MFNDNEKKLFALLVKKELEVFQDEEKTIRPDFPGILKLEEGYESFLKNLLRKLKD